MSCIKKRNLEVVEQKKHFENIEQVCDLKGNYNKCGLITKIFEIKAAFGTGFLINYSFNGLSISQLDIKLHENLKFYKQKKNNYLLFSALIEGEKKINFKDENIEFYQENLESHISYISRVNRSITYSKEKKIKEISIKMSLNFIEKHDLDILLPIFEKYAIDKIRNHHTFLLNNKAQDILNELMLDKRTGILKRLFFESKVLELLSIQIEIKEQKKLKNNSIAKKIYAAEKIITSNLDIQFSVNELAKKTYLNELTLKKEFKRFFGESIFKYSLKARMEEAKKLLYNTSKPIYEIAELVGYKNATHFTAAFKKNEQLTPKQFRK